MSLLLAIETSSDQYAVVLGRGAEVLFNSATECEPSRDLSVLVSKGLSVLAAQVSDIDCIALNVGPGGLSYVRAGVAFANALAFTLPAPIYAFNYFDIIGHQAQTELPLVCAVPAAGGDAYAGLYRNGAVAAMRFGPLANVVAQVAAGFTDVAVAGKLRERLASLLPGTRVIDTGIDRAGATAVFEMGRKARENGVEPSVQVSALNEQASVFYE